MKPGDADLTEPRRGFGPSSTGKNLDSTQEGGLKSQNRLKRHVFMCVNINFSWLKPAHARTHPSHGFYPSHVFARAQESLTGSQRFLFNPPFSTNAGANFQKSKF